MSIKYLKNYWISQNFWESYGGPYSIFPSVHLDLHPEASGTGLTEKEGSATRLVFSFWSYRYKVEFGKIKKATLDDLNWHALVKYGRSKFGKSFPGEKEVKDWCFAENQGRSWVKKVLSLTGTTNHYTRLMIVRHIANDAQYSRNK